MIGSKASSTSHGDNNNGSKFIPAPTWQGAKTGYYFGTGDQGTGYYLDNNNNNDKIGNEPLPKKRRTVQIQEDHNEMRLIQPSSSTSNSSTTLLEQAEQQASGSTIMELTPKGILFASNALERIFQKNALQRAQYVTEPQKYMDSELALHDQLRALLAVAANVDLYQHLVDNPTLLLTLNQLLGHENDDIVAVVVSLYLEWLDPTLLLEQQPPQHDNDTEGQESKDVHDNLLLETLATLAKRVLCEGWEMVVSNFVRFDRQENNNSNQDDDVQDQTLKGLDNSLSLMENILELDMIIPGGLLSNQNEKDTTTTTTALSAAAYMVKETKILSWIFEKLQKAESEKEQVTKGRCLELLSFVAQREDVYQVLSDWSKLPRYTKEPTTSTTSSTKEPTEPHINGIEELLQIIGTYRKVQPKDDYETELLENACTALSSCITFSTNNLSAFLEGQGIELVLRCLKERVHSGGSCLKLLDFFGSQPQHKQACEHLVVVGGLKYLLPIFLGTRIPKPSNASASKKIKAKREWLSMIEAQTIRILYALSRHLDDQSPDDAKARFLTKFVQDETKCDKLVELLLFFDTKARRAEFNFYRSDVEEEVGEEETIQLAALDAKLKGGGDLFHRVGALAAFLSVHSKRCHERIVSQLTLQQSGISLVKAAVEEFSSLLGDGPQKEQLAGYLTIL